MASPETREVPFKFDGTTYLLTFNNAGRRIVEDMLDKEWPEILAIIDEKGIGSRMQSALFFGATRKYHRRQIAHQGQVDELLDKLEEVTEDGDEEVFLDFLASLYTAVFTGSKKDMWLKMFRGEPIEDEAEEESKKPGKKKPGEKEEPAEPEAPKA